MLFALRHPTIVSGNNKKCEIDRADARDHVPNETFVTGNIDNPSVNVVAVRPGKIQSSEPEINRDPARFFFRQPIGIGPSERFDQCTLAMIDVTGGPDDEMMFFQATK